jgi:hypothetical protein
VQTLVDAAAFDPDDFELWDDDGEEMPSALIAFGLADD